jgi:hypothetical protein
MALQQGAGQNQPPMMGPPGAADMGGGAPPDAGIPPDQGGMPPGLDQAMGDPNQALMGGQMPSLDPTMLAAILFQTLQKMQSDDQFAMQMQMAMAQQAMGQQQQVAAQQALAALQQEMAAGGQMLNQQADMPPPATADTANPGGDVTRQLEGMAYPG